MLALFPMLVAIQAAPGVTLNAPFQRLDAVIKAVEAQTGRALSVAPNLRREMVLIRVKDVSQDSLLSQLAHCAHAEWVRDGGRLRLERSAGMERKLADAEHAFRAAGLRANFATVLDDFKALYDPARSARILRRQIDTWVSETKGDPFPHIIPREAQAKSLPLSTGHPARRTLVRLAKLLDFDALAALKVEDGFVLSSSPTGDQRPFSSAMQPILAQFRKDHAEYTKALHGWPGQGDVVGTESADRVTLHVTAYTDDVTLQLHAYDRNGQEVAAGTIELLTDGTPTKEEFDAKGKLKLSPAGVAVETVYNAWTPGRGLKDVREIVRHSDRFPQLSFAWSELLLALAPGPETNVVANVEDELELQCPLEDDSVDLHEAALQLRSRHEIVRTTGWFVVRPRFPGPAGEYRYDRERVAALGRIVDDFLPLPLESIVEPVPTPRTFRVALHLHPLTSGGWFLANPGQVALHSDQRALRLLGALPSSRRARLLQGGGDLTWAEFGPTLQREVSRVLLEGGSGTATSHPRDEHAPPSPSDASEGEGEGGEAQRRRQFIQATFRGGALAVNPVTGDLVSRDALRAVRLRIQVETEPGLVSKDDPPPNGRSYSTALLSPSEIPFAVVPYLPKEGEEVEPANDREEKTQRFRPARHRTVKVRLLLPQNYYVEFEAEDWAFDPQAPFISPEKLPADLVRAIQAIRDRDE